jgi:outer membrane beta-barrel protein
MEQGSPMGCFKKVFLIISFSIISLPHQAFSSESSVYKFDWLDSDKEIYVLQNRKFRKDKSLYVGATGNFTTSGAFIDSIGYSAVAGFFFTENWGVELIYNSASPETNSTYELAKDNALIPYFRQVNDYVGAMLMWSPFYSKINTFDQIFYYDWIFGVGAAQVNTSNNINSFGTSTESTLQDEAGTGILWTSALRFYITETFSIRLDFRGLHTQFDTPIGDEADGNFQKTWFHHYDMGFGLNITF